MAKNVVFRSICVKTFMILPITHVAFFISHVEQRSSL